MKKELFLFGAIMLAVCGRAESSVDYVGLTEKIKRLRIELARQGIYAFVTNRETTPLIAPYIHSQCWVDWLPKTNVEQIAYEQEKRDFGLDFVGGLEEEALFEAKLEDVDSLEHRAVQMLTVAEWLKTAKGYGNHILKTWCEGIAVSALGGMAVNSQSNTNRILKLLRRFDDVQMNVARRLHILNEEAPHRFELRPCSTIDDAANLLSAQWSGHQFKSVKHFDRKFGHRVVTFGDVKNDDPNYAFYINDPALFTPQDEIKDFWRRKNHEAVCVFGLENDMAEQVLQIIRYRTMIGEVPKPTDAELNDLNLAFDYRSRLHNKWRVVTKGKESHFRGGSAVLKVYGRTFVDWCTRTLQLHRERGRK